MPDSTLAPLSNIRTKVRRLTNSPTTSRITNDQIDEYINTFVLYDFPFEIKPDILLGTYSFYLEPYIDKYPSNSVAGSLLNNYKNVYTNFYEPAYIAGSKIYYEQSKHLFDSVYPSFQGLYSIGTGDGATVAYSGTLDNVPMLRENVLFASVDINDAGLAVYDDGDGNLDGDCAPGGTIDYVNGTYSFSFTTAPKSSQDINVQLTQYTAAKPAAVLYYENEFTFRPVPDQPYKFTILASQRPSELLANDSQPELSQWWQLIAYGAAKKILEDRGEMEEVSRITPAFEEQKKLARRKSFDQLTNQRVTTIYSLTNDEENYNGY